MTNSFEKLNAKNMSDANDAITRAIVLMIAFYTISFLSIFSNLIYILMADILDVDIIGNSLSFWFLTLFFVFGVAGLAATFYVVDSRWILNRNTNMDVSKSYLVDINKPSVEKVSLIPNGKGQTVIAKLEDSGIVYSVKAKIRNKVMKYSTSCPNHRDVDEPYLEVTTYPVLHQFTYPWMNFKYDVELILPRNYKATI